MSAETKQMVDDLIEAIGSRPHDFQIGNNTLKDKKTDLVVWIAAGPINHGVFQPFVKQFGIVQSIRFNRYLNRLKAWKTAQILNTA